MTHYVSNAGWPTAWANTSNATVIFHDPDRRAWEQQQRYLALCLRDGEWIRFYRGMTVAAQLRWGTRDRIEALWSLYRKHREMAA